MTKFERYIWTKIADAMSEAEAYRTRRNAQAELRAIHEAELYLRMLRPGDARRDAFDAVKAAGSATAGELHGASDRRIRITGWNNRLADLYETGFLTRTKRGREWVYSVVPGLQGGK